MRLIRVFWRGARLVLHLAAGGLRVLCDPRGVDEFYMRRWCRTACSIVGLRVRAHGTPGHGAVLFAANHVSWLEVLALGSIVPAGFVAKDDVARWPVIGRLAAAAGTLFLRRGSARAASRTVSAAVMRLAAGRAVAVFPEGTSTSGESVLPFKASIFEAAALLGCDVQPVTVYYPGAAGLSAVAPFIGDDELVAHLVRVLGEREVVVNLTFAAPENAHGREREELAQWARREVVSGLEALRRREATEISTMGTAHEYPHRYPFGSGHPGALARDADRRAATLS